MKIKFLAVLALAAFLFLSGCGGTATSNANANKANTATPTPIAKTSETPAASAADVTKIEEALKKGGYTDVTVDGKTTPATLRGTVAKGKMEAMVKVAQEAAGKPLKNEVVEK